MEFYLEPEVVCIAHTVLHPDWQPEEYAFTTDNAPAALVEYSGRQCYLSWANPSGRSNEAYLANILDQQHLSVFDHASVSLRFTQVSRSFTHELVRHRHFGFSQLSQRYVPSEQVNFVVPPAFIGKVDLEAVYREACRQAMANYRLLMEALGPQYDPIDAGVERRKVIRESARSVLPNGTETAIVVSGNMTAWRWFLKMRATQAADWEMRRAAMVVLALLQREAPAIFADFAVQEDERGTYAVCRHAR